MAQIRARIAALGSSDPELGALSLEWVAAALALATFLAGKLGALESLIPN
jgi:hypothetical protein